MDDIDSGEEEDSWDMQISPPVKVPSYNSYKSTKGKPLLGAHPYIVTRCVFIFNVSINRTNITTVIELIYAYWI